MLDFNSDILEAAGSYIGLTEWPGARHNPRIARMFADVGHRHIQDDETPWCAAFVGSVLASLGLPHTGKLNARSYLTYGASVPTQAARPGDIVVLWRGSPTSWQGHVAFFVEFRGDKVILRGGNQGNAVTDQAYDIDRILAVRRADSVSPKGKRPVLREGDSGAWVLDLQVRLKNLGYTVGKTDSVFGGRTLAGVVAFQSDNDLVRDGVVGDETWRKLDERPQRPLRDISAADLKESRTLKAAEEGKNLAVVTAGVGGLASAVAAGEQAYETIERAGDLLSAVWAASPWLIATVVVLGGGWFVWQHFQGIKERRIEDAKTGANDRL